MLREPRRGYGRACLSGFAATNAPDLVVFLDGDYSDRPDELPLLIAPILEGRADITLGSRLAKRTDRDALPWHSVFGNRLAAAMIRGLYGQRVTDLGPFRAARADVLRQLSLEEMTYGWAVEMILKGRSQDSGLSRCRSATIRGLGNRRLAARCGERPGRRGLSLADIVRYRFAHRNGERPV